MLLKEVVFAVLRMIAVVLAIFIPSIILSFFEDALGLTQIIPAIVLLEGIVSVVTVLLICFIVAKIYKIKMRELGMLFTKNWIRNFGIGMVAGIFSITAIWLLAILLGGFTVTMNNLSSTIFLSVFVSFLHMFTVGYSEEVATRGVMSFLGVKNSKLFNAVVTGVIFSLLHFLNPSYNVLSLINTVLVSVIFSMLTWISGDLWIAIGYHMIWNFSLESVFGVSVSGEETGHGLLISSPSSFELVNGGGYGLEASLVCTVFFIIQILLIYVLFIRRGRVSKAPAAPWLA